MQRKNWRRSLRQNGRLLIAALILLDVGAYFGVVRPLRDRALATYQRYNRLRRSLVRQRGKVRQLTVLAERLKRTGSQLEDFYRNNFFTRGDTFSRLSNLLRRTAAGAGVELDEINYQVGESEENSVQYISVRTATVADWAALMRFLHRLERAQALILIDDVSIGPSTFPGLLRLQVNLKAYLRPRNELERPQ